MDKTEIIFATINILVLIITTVAVWLSPIQAVKIGQKLQQKDKLYTNKFYVFATLIGNRHAKGGAENFVVAINQIPIVFQDDKKVLLAWDKYIQAHTNATLTLSDLNSYLNDLVIALANDLGYKDIGNDLLVRYFYPDASFFRYESDHLVNLEYVKKNRQAPDAQHDTTKKA